MPFKRQHQNTDVTLLKSRGEFNKGLVSLLSKKHPTLPSTGQGSHRNAVVCFKKILWLFKLGTSAFPGLHLQCCVLLSGLWHCQDRLMCHLPELGTAGMKHDKAEGWGWAHSVQVTLSKQRRPKEGIAATSVLREAMRHPKLHFQNLLSPTAFGGLWEHGIGLSSCLWSPDSFCAYSQIKWVSRPKGFKLIPPNKKKKNPLDPLKHFIWAWKTTQGGTKYQRVLWSSSGNRVKYFISLSATSTYQMCFY